MIQRPILQFIGLMPPFLEGSDSPDVGCYEIGVARTKKGLAAENFGRQVTTLTEGHRALRPGACRLGIKAGRECARWEADGDVFGSCDKSYKNRCSKLSCRVVSFRGLLVF